MCHLLQELRRKLLTVHHAFLDPAGQRPPEETIKVIGRLKPEMFAQVRTELPAQGNLDRHEDPLGV